jgi:predicted porin
MLKKLSLAALVAMGSMSFAGATDLSSAIQGVQLNGYLRVRAYYHNDDNTDNGGNSDSYRRWRTNAKLVFGVPVADNTKIVWRINAQQDFQTQRTHDDGKRSDLGQSLFFLNYAKDGIGANVGVIPLGFLPYASSDSFSTAHGAGADATYTIGDVTLAAGYVDHMWNISKKINSNKQIDNDVYTLGAIYKNKEIGSAQLWYARIADLLDYDAMLLTDIKIPGGFGVKFDYGQSKLTTAGAKSHKYANLAFTAKIAGVNAIVGAAKTNDRAGKINTSADSKIGTTAGELRHNVANMTNAKSLYAKAGYNVTKAANVFVAYDNIKADEGDSNEYEVGAKYKVNKKFGISGYYDILNMSDNSATDQQEARVEFKYSF